MHIYAFIVPHMHKMHLNAFWLTYAPIYVYFHTLIHEDTTILDSVLITMHMGASYGY